jgi:hypothetical protein
MGRENILWNRPHWSNYSLSTMHLVFVAMASILGMAFIMLEIVQLLSLVR